MALELLDITEQERLNNCERIIERGLNTFVDVGLALLEIRDNRLYRWRAVTVLGRNNPHPSALSGH